MPMWDGFKTYISFQALGTVFPEISVKPFGLDGRGPIDVTSMRNTRYVTKWPKQLIDLTPIEADCQWTPGGFVQIKQFVLQVNQIISVRMPTTDVLDFYGFLDKADPQPQKEGEVPIIRFTIVPTNVNGIGVEMPPRFNGVGF